MGSPDLTVDTAFTASDRITRALNKMDKSVDKFGRSANNAFNKANKSAGGFRSVMKGILAAGAVQKGLSVVATGVNSVWESFVELDQAATSAGAKFKDIGPDASDLAERIAEIKSVARDLGGKTEKAPEDMGKALEFLAKAGWDSANAFKALAPLVDMSTATGEEFTRVADIASDLMGSFGLSVKEPGQNLKNLNRLIDVLTSTSNKANVTVEDMFETMKEVGPVAKGILKISLEEVSAATGLLGDNAIKGSKAMTQMRNIYLRLAAPPTEAAKAMDLLNISMKDAAGQPKTLGVVMSEIKESLKDFDPTDAAGALNDIFGRNAIAGAGIILNNLDKLAAKEKALEGIEGTTARTAGVLRKTVKGRIEELKSTLTELGLGIISPFEDDIKAGISRLTKFFREVDTKPFVDGVKVIFDKLKEVDLNELSETLSTGFRDTVQDIKDFAAAIERVWTKIEPIVDAINSFIVDDKPKKGPVISTEQMVSGFMGMTPQQTESRAKAQQMTLNQNIDINSAPAGTTADVKTTSAPGIKQTGRGYNIAFGMN